MKTVLRTHPCMQTLTVFYIKIVRGTVRSIPGHFQHLQLNLEMHISWALGISQASADHHQQIPVCSLNAAIASCILCDEKIVVKKDRLVYDT